MTHKIIVTLHTENDSEQVVYDGRDLHSAIYDLTVGRFFEQALNNHFDGNTEYYSTVINNKDVDYAHTFRNSKAQLSALFQTV